MRSARLSPRPEVTPAPAWRVKGPGHHVLTDGVHVIGHVVEAPDGTFVSFDATAKPIARHDTLSRARTRVSHATGWDGDDTRRAPAGAFAFAVGRTRAVAISGLFARRRT